MTFAKNVTGSAEIAGVGVSIAIYNQVSKVCIYPLVSVTTSFVAEEDAIISDLVDKEKMKDLEKAPPPPGAEELSPSDSGEIKLYHWILITWPIFSLCFGGLFSISNLMDDIKHIDQAFSKPFN